MLTLLMTAAIVPRASTPSVQTLIPSLSCIVALMTEPLAPASGCQCEKCKGYASSLPDLSRAATVTASVVPSVSSRCTTQAI